MRCFRLWQRDAKTKQIIKHRDYVGIDNLIKHGKQTYERYNYIKKVNISWDGQGNTFIEKIQPIQMAYPELCENINGNWIPLNEKEIEAIFE